MKGASIAFGARAIPSVHRSRPLAELHRREPRAPASTRGAVLLPLCLFAGLSVAGLAMSEKRSADRAAHMAPSPWCPARARPDPARAERVLERLASVPRGAPLASVATARLVICFGPAGGVALVEPSTAVLDEQAADSDNAALLGHLAAHATELAALPDLDPELRDCDAFVDHAIDAEANAYALEVALRAELGVRGSPRSLPFESALAFATDTERRARIREYLLEHPDGDGTLTGLAHAYWSRCVSSRGSPE